MLTQQFLGWPSMKWAHRSTYSTSECPDRRVAFTINKLRDGGREFHAAPEDGQFIGNSIIKGPVLAPRPPVLVPGGVRAFDGVPPEQDDVGFW